MAVTYNRFEVAKVLLESGAVKDAHNNVRYTPIQIACSFGHSRIVKLHMDHNVSVNILQYFLLHQNHHFLFFPCDHIATHSLTRIWEILFFFSRSAEKKYKEEKKIRKKKK